MFVPGSSAGGVFYIFQAEGFGVGSTGPQISSELPLSCHGPVE